jgi:protein phosphatase
MGDIMGMIRKLLGSIQPPDSTPTASLEPKPEKESLAPSKLRVGWATDVGIRRDHNEDTALIITAAHDGDHGSPPFGLFVLADGMGGHQAGELASSLAARVTAYHILRQSYLATLIDQEGDAARPALNEMLIEAVRAANSAVIEQVPGSGTTLTCALVLGLQAYIAHVGDSRAYVITSNGLEQVTRDHSLVDRLVEAGQLTRDEAVNHPQRNVLYRAVGQESSLSVSVYVRPIPPDGQLLLCSDGLWDLVSESEIQKVVENSSSPQAACDALIETANQAGGRDNVTAVLLEPPLG